MQLSMLQFRPSSKKKKHILGRDEQSWGELFKECRNSVEFYIKNVLFIFFPPVRSCRVSSVRGSMGFFFFFFFFFPFFLSKFSFSLFVSFFLYFLSLSLSLDILGILESWLKVERPPGRPRVTTQPRRPPPQRHLTQATMSIFFFFFSFFSLFFSFFFFFFICSLLLSLCWNMLQP